ncbi:MAG TPA: hypothetical protein VFM55_08800 [Micromonosporaceae bacterium]|nr:hypothetical protein [Micromonosporaceae bacterium]
MGDENVLEQRLRRAAELFDPVPPRSTAVAIAAFGWRTIDTELAELVFDSLDEVAATVRGGAQPRLLTFEGSGLTIEVELTVPAPGPPASGSPSPGSPPSAAPGGARRVVGRVLPGQPADIEVWQGDRRAAGTADALGRFAVTAPGSGPLRLRVRPAGDTGGRAVVTDWVIG